MVPDTTDRPVTEFVGRDVYTTNGESVGTATGVAVDLNGGVATSLTIADPNPDLFGPAPRDARGVQLPFRWVDAAGDIVLVASVVERASSTGTTDADDNSVDTGDGDTDDARDSHLVE